MEGGHEAGRWGGGDGEGSNGEGETGRGQWGEGGGKRGGGDREGETGRGMTGRGMTERGQREGKEEGKHIECLGGMRLQFFLTLFTRATPGTPASIYYKIHRFYIAK